MNPFVWIQVKIFVGGGQLAFVGGPPPAFGALSVMRQTKSRFNWARPVIGLMPVRCMFHHWCAAPFAPLHKLVWCMENRAVPKETCMFGCLFQGLAWGTALAYPPTDSNSHLLPSDRRQQPPSNRAMCNRHRKLLIFFQFFFESFGTTLGAVGVYCQATPPWEPRYSGNMWGWLGGSRPSLE